MPKIKCSIWLPGILCLFHRLLPSPVFWGLIAASAIHELGHILIIYYTGGKVVALKLGIFGAVISTSSLSYLQEIFCTLAGPVFGLTLLIFRPLYPWLAFWALVQNVYNLLPVYPLDGGRILRALFCMFFPLEKAIKLSQTISLTTAFLVGICGYLYLRPVLPQLWLFPFFILLFQFFTAQEYKFQLQKNSFHDTI